MFNKAIYIGLAIFCYFNITTAHAASVAKMKPVSPAPTYEVEGKEVSATEAILAYLNGHRVFQHKQTKTAYKTSETTQEMMVQDGRTGPKLTAKKD